MPLRIVLVAWRADDLGDVALVHREREGSAAVRRRNSGAGEDLRGGRRLHGHLRAVRRRGDHEVRPEDRRTLAPALLVHHAVVAGHRRARKEERGVVRVREALDLIELVVRARGPILVGRPAGGFVLDRVELVDADRHVAHEVVRAAVRDDRSGERDACDRRVRIEVLPLERRHPGQIELLRLSRGNRAGLARRVGPGDRDVRGLSARVRHDDGEVEDRPDRVARDGRPVVAADVRLRGARRGARGDRARAVADARVAEGGAVAKTAAVAAAVALAEVAAAAAAGEDDDERNQPAKPTKLHVAMIAPREARSECPASRRRPRSSASCRPRPRSR